MNDAHCHFFSSGFFAALGRQMSIAPGNAPDAAALAALGWDAPGTPDDLADRWVSELDRAGVARAALIASVPGDASSVGAAVKRHPTRFVGWFMLDPTHVDAPAQAEAALDTLGLRGVCLFPALHRFDLHDPRVGRIFDIAAVRPGTVVFVHCGALSIGARTKLGLPGRFDSSLGNPLHLQPLALEFPHVPIVIPHFGAGFLREALMVADLCRNVYFDTSSSNRWLGYHPGLTLADVFRYALSVAGPERLLFGTDSSFFPRGWVQSVYTQQAEALRQLDTSADVRALVFGGNFDRLFPLK